MQIVLEEVDNLFYADVILNPEDIQKLHKAEMVNGEIYFKHRKCYVGVRLQGSWDYEEEVKRPKESFQGDEGIFPRKAPQRRRGRPRSDES